MGKVRRFKDDDEMTVADWVEHGRTGQRPERDEYRQARRRALQDAGLEPDEEPGERSIDEHLEAIRRRR